jgi:hypothetical protein
MSPSDRRSRRAEWQVQVFSGDDRHAIEDASARFWLAVPLAQRAAMVWQLSLETFALAGYDVERRLSRSDFRVQPR